MYSLRQALLDHDLIVLRILGEWYDLDLVGQDKEQCADALSAALQAANFQEEVNFLQPDESAAIMALVVAGGKIPVATFKRDFGEVRQMGPGKLEREEPWLMPESPAEALWYRGFLFRGFDETDDGLVEYYFVPPELMAKIEVPKEEKKSKKQTKKKSTEPEAAPAPEFKSAAMVDVERFIAQAKAKQSGKNRVVEEVDKVGSGEVKAVAVEDSAEKPKKPTTKPKPKTKPKAKEPAPKPKIAPVKKKTPAVKQQTAPPPKQAAPKQAPNPIVKTPVQVPTEAETTSPTPPLLVSPTSPLLSNSDAVDDLTTILAHAQRQPMALADLPALARFLRSGDTDRLSLLVQLALDGSLLRRADDGQIKPARSAVKWLQQPREQQLRRLIETWRGTSWNALRRVPGLLCEGDWQNDPKRPREALITALPRSDKWLPMGELIQAVKSDNPDFQRPDGDYESWYIRDEQSNAFLSGFESWDFVEGNVLEYVVFRPMFWLGLTDVSGDDDQPALRLTPRALAWLNDRSYAPNEPDLPLILQPDATLLVPQQASRFFRFQATRIAEPQPLANGQPYTFRITPASLAHAKVQGIAPDRVLQFLQKATGQQLPAAPKRAIERWQQNGTEGRLDQLVVLRVGDPAVIATLRSNPKTRDLLGESLGELAVAVRLEDAARLRHAVAQLGLLLDFG